NFNELRIEFNLHETKKITFLIFGYLDIRKGIEASIKILSDSRAS
ncbi:MAG: hypothetical protein ACI9QN_001826, partial [Arcticibacterium sp.]